MKKTVQIEVKVCDRCKQELADYENMYTCTICGPSEQLCDECAIKPEITVTDNFQNDWLYNWPTNEKRDGEIFCLKHVQEAREFLVKKLETAVLKRSRDDA